MTDSISQHGVNMNTSLLTFDGFPRADIDVAQIRTTRARIIRLKNDYKDVMKKVEVAVEEQFAAGKPLDSAQSSQASRSAPAVDAMVNGGSASSAIEPPFAKVNSVAENSPAEDAGLRAGDKVTKFGTANWTNHERLGKVAQVVQQNENVRLATSP
jgi:26S proteasome regulatory subunit N4